MAHHKKREVNEATREAAQRLQKREFGALKNFQWAWAFLQRWSDYERAYQAYAGLSPALQAAVSRQEFREEVPVQYLSLEPPPQSARTYGQWLKEQKPQFSTSRELMDKAIWIEVKPVGEPGLSANASVTQSPSAEWLDSLFPSHFGLKQWIDPALDPAKLSSNPFLPPPIEVRFATTFARVKDGTLRTKAHVGKSPLAFERTSDALILVDVSLPIEAQLKAAKLQLVQQAKRLRDIAGDHARSHGNTSNRFAVLLLAFDLKKNLGLTDGQASEFFNKTRKGNDPDEDYVRGRRVRAGELINGDYRFLAFAKSEKRRKKGG